MLVLISKFILISFKNKSLYMDAKSMLALAKQLAIPDIIFEQEGFLYVIKGTIAPTKNKMHPINNVLVNNSDVIVKRPPKYIKLCQIKQQHQNYNTTS